MEDPGIPRANARGVQDLLVDQMRDGHIVARTAEEAAKTLRSDFAVTYAPTPERRSSYRNR